MAWDPTASLLVHSTVPTMCQAFYALNLHQGAKQISVPGLMTSGLSWEEMANKEASYPKLLPGWAWPSMAPLSLDLVMSFPRLSFVRP